MKNKSIFMLCILILLSNVLLFGCDFKVPPADGGGAGIGVNEMERGFVYMWHKYGLGADLAVTAIQTESYAMEIDSFEGKILRLGNYYSSEKDLYYEYDPQKLFEIGMDYSVIYDGKVYPYSRSNGFSRIIDSGRYMQRMDFIQLKYKGENAFYGRLEIAATLKHFALNYELYSDYALQDAALSFSLDFGNDFSAENYFGGRGIKILNEDGDGFIFLKPADDGEVSLNFENGKLTISKQDINFDAKRHKGFGVLCFPIRGSDEGAVQEYLAMESLQIEARAIAPQTVNLNPEFDFRRGFHIIDVSNLNVGSMSNEPSRMAYERVEFEIANNTQHSLNVPIVFTKAPGTSFSVTGMSPMIRDGQTLEPIGRQVQISKNWHYHNSTDQSRFNYAPLDDVRRNNEGQWYRGYVMLEANPGTEKYEYTCAYGTWGGIYAASHAQLSLIGYAGNQVWDQSALGSWGESVTYDPDRCLGRAHINDVRPFLVTSPTGNDKQFGWTGNVGGGDFLTYTEEKEQKLIGQKITYYMQAPNLTKVNYSGITENNKIRSDITIMLGRTDDIVRNYYRIKYTFLEDVSYDRLSLFKIAADGYADNRFTKYAIGDYSGILIKDQNAMGMEIGYPDESSKNVRANEGFWFLLYNSSIGEENGDVMYVVREFKANLNGKTYNTPAYSLYGTFNLSLPQVSCEVTLPKEAGKVIKKGSTVEMLIEYDILPADKNTYYGQADYFLENLDIMGTPESAYLQVDGGRLTANALKGQILSVYPLAIKVDQAGEAHFTLSGGLGYVPVVFEGLDNYSGYSLMKNTTSGWVKVDQSVHGNDFWQAYRNPATGKYTLIYNIKNNFGLDYSSVNEYRLVKE